MGRCDGLILLYLPCGNVQKHQVKNNNCQRKIVTKKGGMVPLCVVNTLFFNDIGTPWRIFRDSWDLKVLVKLYKFFPANLIEDLQQV